MSPHFHAGAVLDIGPARCAHTAHFAKESGATRQAKLYTTLGCRPFAGLCCCHQFACVSHLLTVYHICRGRPRKWASPGNRLLASIISRWNAARVHFVSPMAIIMCLFLFAGDKVAPRFVACVRWPCDDGVVSEPWPQDPEFGP